MKFCTGLPIAMFIHDARQGKPRSIEKVARGVEELGFWGITVPHHVLYHGMSILGHEGAQVPQWRYPDPIAMLAYLAAVTTTVRLIPRVIVVPWRRPFELAHGLASVDSLSGGRLVFCPAPGGEPKEFGPMGVPMSQRGRITDEYLEIMYRLWAEPKVTFHGRYHSFEDVSLLVKPVQQPRPLVWVGGSSQAALRRAVRMGDGWTPTCYAYPYVPGATRGAVSTGHLREDIAWSSAERRLLGKPPLEYAVSSAPPLKFLDRPRHARRRALAEIEYFTCEGTPDELLDEFQAYREAGATSFVVNFWGETPEEFLQSAGTFAKRIMPALSKGT